MRWWEVLLANWSSLNIEPRLDWHTHKVWTDASGKKGIGGFYNSLLFATKVPKRHNTKHINWKEMYAVQHAFLLWHKHWEHGKVLLYGDNSAVVDGLNKKSIDGPTIHPLQTILIIAAAFDIELVATWIPSEENVIADAASRFEYAKFHKLRLTAQLILQLHHKDITKASTIHRTLYSFFTMPSLL